MYIGWASNVNKIILDSTTITVGDGATVEDGLEAGGPKKKRLVSANPSDKYNITMSFDYVTKGSDGYTELERFYVWYKYVHCYGVNPFEFPAILINSNRQYGEGQEDVEHIIRRIENHDPTARLPDTEYYIISSAVEGSKNGTHLQITMTWETYATGSFTIPDETSTIDHIEAAFYQKYYDSSVQKDQFIIDVILTATPVSEPTKNTWTIYGKKGSGSWITMNNVNIYFDDAFTAKVLVEQTHYAGTWTFKIGDFTSNGVTVS